MEDILTDYSFSVNPIQIKGNWDLGWVLDKHCVQNKYSKSNTEKETRRTELGEAIYKFKYGKTGSSFLEIEPIAFTFGKFISNRNELLEVDAILYTPATNRNRKYNPIELIAKKVGKYLDIPVSDDYLLKIKETVEMKDLYDFEARKINVKGAFKIADQRFINKKLLILDDIIDSGETLSTIVSELRSEGKPAKIFVLVGTYTDCYLDIVKNTGERII
jgi:predicted amidophosphoribosyltransferase